MLSFRSGATLCVAATLTVLTARLAAGQTPDAPASQDQATTVEILTATASLAAVPTVGAGAPMLAPEEIHALGQDARSHRETFEDGRAKLFECYMRVFGVRPNPDRMMGYDAGADAAREMSNWSRPAEDATRALEQARHDRVSGKISEADLEKVELDRQKAVNAMVKAEADYDEARMMTIDIQELIRNRESPQSWRSVVLNNSAQRTDIRTNGVAKQYEELGLEGVRAVERKDQKGQAYLYLTGSIRNARTTPVPIPPLSITAVDQKGAPLRTERALGRGRIEAGQAIPFTYTLTPSPPNTASAKVTFGDLGPAPALQAVETDPVCQYHPLFPYSPKGAEQLEDPNNLLSPSGVAPDDIAFLDPRLIMSGGTSTVSGRVNLIPPKLFKEKPER